MSDLFHIIRYSIYCHFFEFEPSEVETYQGYLIFWDREDVKTHSGDCIKQNYPCLKCQADWINEDADKAYKAVGVIIPHLLGEKE